MDVLPGQTYYLYIDNWVDVFNPTMAPFSLNWGGTATLASPFTDPNIQTHPFIRREFRLPILPIREKLLSAKIYGF
jgi:hypothetical protein